MNLKSERFILTELVTTVFKFDFNYKIVINNEEREKIEIDVLQIGVTHY